MSSLPVLFRSFAIIALAGSSPAQVQPTWSTFVGGGVGIPESAGDSAVDGAGATYVIGSRDVDATGATAFRTVLTKVDASGAIAWRRPQDPQTVLPPFDRIGVDATGNVVVVASGSSPGVTHVARYDTNGNQLWQRVLVGPSGEPMHTLAMRVAPTGETVLAGYVFPSSSLADAFVARLRPDGTTAWTHVHVGSPGWSDSAFDVVLDAAGNVYATGQVGTNFDFVAGLLALKLAPDGTLAWSTELLPPATGHHQGQHAAVDAQGRLVVAGGIL